MHGPARPKETPRLPLVLDFMEPARPRVDAIVLGFFATHRFRPSDFALGPDGACRVHPQLARVIVAEIDRAIGEPVARAMDLLAENIKSRSAASPGPVSPRERGLRSAKRARAEA